MNFEVGRNVLLTMGGIVALLIVATLLTQLLKRVRPQWRMREIELRVRSWWIMAAVFSIALLLARNISLIFFTLISFLAFKEYLSLIPLRDADRRIWWLAYLAIPMQYYWIYLAWYGMFIIWIPVYMFLFMPLRMVLIGETRGFLGAAGTLHWGLMTMVFSISHVAYLLVLPGEGNPQGGGAGLVLFLVVLTQLNDVLQFLWGKALGRTAAVPTVSPNKTLEGLLGALFTTVGLSYLLAPLLTPLDRLESLSAGLLIGLFGFIGDVVISALKRDVGVKDSGGLIPGHGGILDRLDSLTYTAPLFFHFVKYTHF